jgi:nucleoside-diphosphate-sugar epimerase
MFGDIRNKDSLEIALNVSQPEIIFHLAKKRLSEEYCEIFDINVMGAVNLLQLSTSLDKLKKIIIAADENDDDIYTASKKAAFTAAKAYEPLLKDKGVTLVVTEVRDVNELLFVAKN